MGVGANLDFTAYGDGEGEATAQETTKAEVTHEGSSATEEE